MRGRRLTLLLVVGIVAAGCGGGGPASSSTTTTTAATTTTATVETTTTTVPETTTTTVTTTPPDDATLVVPPVGEIPTSWQETLFIPYGSGEEALGTAPGGDGGSLDLGPEYGAQDADGGWWFLDAAKLRIAHYTAGGDFVDALPVPEELLTNGIYFQYQSPRVLDDGTLVATGFGSAQTRVLLMADGTLSAIAVPREVGVRVDDGRLLYGHAFDGDPGPVVIDLEAGTTAPTEWFHARNGDRFRITAEGDRLRVEMPDAGFDRTWDLEAGEIGGRAFASVEAATGEDGSLHLLLIGIAEDDESLQLAGYLRIGGDGQVGPLEPMRDPFSPSDPGSPSHLGMRPGSSDPWLMFVDVDGVRVYSRG